ncbi:MAG: 1-acyl-sn-glycerol-3-phosphate acyltransferase [Gemmatimonadota bacterium]|nr:1-acyl-sn-glycerol-3-phosphate acyltransferase [Gemmatimonadota bacterium]
MRSLYETLASIWTWLVLIVTVIVWLPLVALLFVVTAPFDRSRYLVGRFFRRIASVIAVINPLWHFRVSGERVSDPRRPYVVVSNHESFTDIFLISLLPWEMKWLSKAELFRVPVVGWEMWLAGDIPIHRGVGPSAIEAMNRCRRVLHEWKVSVMIFPEGTRSRTGEMLPFKEGAFRLAIDAGVPILPLALAGTGPALRKHDWRMGRSVAEVRVLPPVETTGLSIADVPALRDRVRAMITEARDAMRARTT